MILLNGQPSECIPITDRGLQYGDGCFTSMLVKHGVVSAWMLHDKRLQTSVKYLGIMPIDWNDVCHWVRQAAKSQQYAKKSIVKVIITRGTGGRGYNPIGCHSPNVLVSTHTYPLIYEKWCKEGIQVVLLEQRLGISPLAGFKCLNRLEQVMLKREVQARGADDGVVCDMHDHLVETSNSNLFWRKDNTLFTPNLLLAGVCGTMREQVIAVVGELGFDLQEVSIGSEVLRDADEVFITNAIMGIIPVRCIENIHYSSFDACKRIILRLCA
ncbi:aminodeoxychorismate lyase [Candidatus Enterovibrio escicola]|uniref:Aminodeoxychorismate lyase n=1 Tax=Candidatus Enterovibrio escicola TaxID=1927127 RepID=A0A2A5T2H5_9GAMM|nr:aminodeoxychorismate lyase [Candidatus Enterovibrio escacola]PCS22330.1 Aminodeoxychorismate lyase [Candidatus Enterovibrio escacola]